MLSSIEKYNFWNQNQPDTGFERTFYSDKIFRYTGNNLVKVLVGQRRAGKSYILRQIAKRFIAQGVSPNNILYINREFMEFNFLNDDKSLEELFHLYKSTFQPQGKVYLFIDEIQNIEGWERFVNSHSQDFVEECELFITGSNSQLLSGELATLLSGRYVEFLILPFGYIEYIALHSLPQTGQTYETYLKGGGLPELFRLPDEETRYNYVSAVKDTVLLRDIVLRHKIKEVKLLEDIFVYLANNLSNFCSVPNVVNYFKSKNRKTNYETVSSYVSYIEDSFLIYKSERYNIKGKETLAGNCKYYLNDLSFKNYLYPGFIHGVGYLLENAVYLELLRYGYKVYTGNIKDKEVDFVAIKGEKKIYLQCAYLLTDEQTVEREYSALQNIPDNYSKYVVSLDPLTLPSNNGIQHIQAWKLSEILN